MHKQAKDFNESIPVIKEWAKKLNAWRKRFLEHSEVTTYTVETLKLLAIADLVDRYGNETKPRPGLITTNSGSIRSVDGGLHAFGPVYIFLPDTRRAVTHLYSMSPSGEIRDRTELPGTELEILDDIHDSSLILEGPFRDRDPTVDDDGV